MKLHCDNCNALTEYTVTTENRTYNVKGILINADVQITRCNECGDEIYNREAEIENDKVIFGKYEKEIHDERD